MPATRGSVLISHNRCSTSPRTPRSKATWFFSTLGKAFHSVSRCLMVQSGCLLCRFALMNQACFSDRLGIALGCAVYRLCSGCAMPMPKAKCRSSVCCCCSKPCMPVFVVAHGMILQAVIVLALPSLTRHALVFVYQCRLPILPREPCTNGVDHIVCHACWLLGRLGSRLSQQLQGQKVLFVFDGRTEYGAACCVDRGARNRLVCCACHYDPVCIVLAIYYHYHYHYHYYHSPSSHSSSQC
jgi:hypothetical protein